MSIKKSILVRVRIVFLAVLAFGAAIIIRTSYVQIGEGDKWRKMAEEISLRYMTVKATRGNIYSDNGSLLATSLPFYKVTMDPTVPSEELFNEKIDSLSMMLSRFFGDKSAKEYKRKIKNARLGKKRYVILSHEQIGFQDKKRMSSWPIIREGRLKGGVIFDKVEKRFMPFGNTLAFRTIGFINDNKTGVGLELSFNSKLAGRDGKALFTKIAGNNWKAIHDESEIRPEQGLDIQTTLDVNLQDVAEDALYRHLVSHNADYGCVVLMEVATGEIKAIANLGKAGEGRYIENYNYAVGGQGLTDPGSTFKLASMMALLEENNLALDDTIATGNGKYKFYDQTMTDSKPEGYGNLTLIDAFAKSSNIAVSKLVVRHFGNDPKKYRKYIRKFGLDAPMDFQMKGSAVPYIKSPGDSTWSGVTLPWMSIGYEMKMSPLQMLAFYNAVANNGTLVRPMIVKSVWQEDKKKEEFKTVVLEEKICSKETLDKLKLMLEAVTDHGTAKNIRNENYKIAGKTGTAQKIVRGVYTNKSYYTSFVGYFPAQKPKYSCVVVIDNPQGFLQYGSDVAAPVFKEVADKIFAKDAEMHKPLDKEEVAVQSGIFPTIRAGYYDDLRYLCNALKISNHASSESEWVNAQAVNNAVMWKSKKISEGLMPDVTGLTLKDALYLLENSGLKVRFEGKGRVVTQSITAGSRIVKGYTAYLKLD